jgi:hypothetical protein
VLEIVALEIAGERLVLEVVGHASDRTGWPRCVQRRGLTRRGPAR